MRQLKIRRQPTSRESFSIEKYLQDIGKVDLLSPAQEVELAKMIKQGDERALEKLVKANLRFVVSTAKQYQNQGLSLSDLINEGNIGLMKAAQRFDETKGFKFISYAVWWIRQSIMTALTEDSKIVRYPNNKTGLSHKIFEVSLQTLQELEREPTNEELAEKLDIKVHLIESAQTIQHRHISMDAPLDGTKPKMYSEGNGLLEVIPNESEPPDKNLEHLQSLRKELDASLSILTDREQTVLRLLYGIDVPYALNIEEVAKRLGGLSRERVRQIKEKAFRKLRREKNRANLMPFLQ